MAVAAAAIAAVPTAASATGPKTKAIDLILVGGGTTVQLDAAAAAKITGAGVAVAPVGAAYAGPSGITFPITIGRVDQTTLAGQIRHLGGLSFTQGSTVLKATRYFINVNESPVLTAKVSLNGTSLGRLPLFKVVPTQGPSIVHRTLTLAGVNLTLTPEAAGALNDVFAGGAPAFAEDELIATATVKSRIVARVFGGF
jgi:hypothetical protein